MSDRDSGVDSEEEITMDELPQEMVRHDEAHQLEEMQDNVEIETIDQQQQPVKQCDEVFDVVWQCSDKTEKIDPNCVSNVASSSSSSSPSSSPSSQARASVSPSTHHIKFDFSSISLSLFPEINDFIKQLYVPSTSKSVDACYSLQLSKLRHQSGQSSSSSSTSSLPLVPYTPQAKHYDHGDSHSPINKLVKRFEGLDFKPKMRKHIKPCPYGVMAEQVKLRQAVINRNVEKVSSLIAAGASVNVADARERTLLHLASAQGCAEIVELLLRHGANPNKKDSVGNTPLHLAVCASKMDVITLLIKYRADVWQADQHGRTPITLARSKLALYSSELRTKRVNSPQLLSNLVQIVDMLLEYFRQSLKTTSTTTANNSMPSTSSKMEKEIASQWLGQLGDFKAKVASNQSGAEVIEQDVKDLMKALEMLNISP